MKTGWDQYEQTDVVTIDDHDPVLTVTNFMKPMAAVFTHWDTSDTTCIGWIGRDLFDKRWVSHSWGFMDSIGDGESLESAAITEYHYQMKAKAERKAERRG